jgi:uncharacterized protein with WD repeat
VLAGTANIAGHYEFFDVERKRSLGVYEHPHATGLAWDPAGRTVATYKTCNPDSATRDTVGNGYNLFTFQGTKIFELSKPRLFQFDWRPRPASYVLHR